MGDIFDDIFGFTEKVVNGVVDTTESLVDHTVNAADTLIGTGVKLADTLIQTGVNVGLPVAKTIGELAIGGLVGPAPNSIKGPVGGIASLLDTGDGLRSAVRAVPDTLREIRNNFEQEE